MATSAFTTYSNAVLELTKAQINLGTDAFVMALLSGGYTPAPNTDTLWSDVSAYELGTGSGYTAGGVLLASQTDVLASGVVTFTAASPSWSTFTAGPFRYAVISRRAGASLVAGDLLLCYSDLTGSGTLTGAGGSFTVTISGSGILQLTHTP